jgi:hypothetical protein
VPLLRCLITHALFVLTLQASAAEYPPADHHGQDLILTNGDIIWGTHLDVGTFRTTAGTTATVLATTDTIAGSGGVRIEARDIDLQGTLSADGAGFPGGAGGAWGVTYCFVFSCGPPAGEPGSPGLGPAGGPADGGYALPTTSGDLTVDASVQAGSGGAGGRGQTFYETILIVREPAEARAGDYGGAGGSGGGKIELVASNQLHVAAGSLISANGAPGLTNGLADRGFDGAGGGILLQSTGGNPPQIDEGATFSSLGGGGSPYNGGTLKVLSASTTPLSPAMAFVHVGRALFAHVTPAELWGAWRKSVTIKSHYSSKHHRLIYSRPTASFQVRNDGGQRSGAATVRFYGSETEQSLPTATLLAEKRLRSLAPGDTQRFTMRLPRREYGFPYYPFYLFAVVDGDGQVDEFIEDNNESRLRAVEPAP